MITLYLVRHASYTNPRHIMPGRLPVPLSKTGIKEAQKLQRFFADKSVDTIHSSAVLRCQQTAEIISNGKIPIIFDQRLLETMSAFQGYWIQDGRHFFGHRRELGGETNQDIQTRMIDFFHSTLFEDNKSYIICSHGDPLYFLYQFFKKEPLITDPSLNQPLPKYLNYQLKGSIRPVHITGPKHDQFKILPTITSSSL